MTLVLDSSFIQQIEFDQILKDLESRAVSQPVKDRFKRPELFLDEDIITEILKEVSAFKKLIEQSEAPEISTFQTIDDIAEVLHIENFVLNIEQILRIRAIVLNYHGLNTKLTSAQTESENVLLRHLAGLQNPNNLLSAIHEIIDLEGNIKDSASEKLGILRKKIQQKRAKLDQVFQSVIQRLRASNVLNDSGESVRSGRRVLAVKAEHKRKINGIIHDVSGTNQTVFIEPQELVLAHNEIYELQDDIQKEIYRILKILSATISVDRDELIKYQNVLLHFDDLQARARQAHTLQAKFTKSSNKPNLSFKEARHPLLIFKHNSDISEVIPFDLQLFGQNHMLIISGPNAGGKSITLKAIALLQCMHQYGLLIPADNQSQMGIFKSFFADIGDNQSIDQDLSTYSSHLVKMRRILETADKNSLVLIDELGSGTDPKLGGAMAQAILERLHKRSIYAIVTTHYSNLKLFAHRTKGVVNGSMLFDKDQLAPTYKLKVGRPGSSYAFEVASKSGLPQQLINRAKKLSGVNNEKLEDLLVYLQSEKAKVESERQSVEARQKQLEQLIKNYEQLQFDMSVRRKKMKIEEKSQALHNVEKSNKALEKVIREIREKENLKAAKDLAAKIKSEKKTIREDLQKLNSTPEKVKKAKKDITIGDFVRTPMGTIGEILEIKKGKAIVQSGIMRLEVPTKDLSLANAPIDTKNTKSIHHNVDLSQRVYRKIEIIGLRKAEARKRLEKFFDDALMQNLSQVEVIHGIGSGALRRTVRETLDEYNVAFEIRHPEEQYGGEAISIVEFN